MKRLSKLALPLTLSTLLMANQASGFEGSGDVGARDYSDIVGSDDGNIVESIGCNPYPKGTIGTFFQNFNTGWDLSEKVSKIMKDKFGVSQSGNLFHGSKDGAWYVNKPNVYKSTITKLPNFNFLLNVNFDDGRVYRSVIKYQKCKTGDKK